MKKLLTTVLLIVPLVHTLGATMVVPGDLGDLAREARVIALGRIVSVESRWTENHRGIETLVTLDAERYLKGNLGQTPVFHVPGGRVGRFRRVTVGAPEFVTGQRVVVFLGAREPRLPFILGLSQGVFRMVQGPDGWLVTPPPVLPASDEALRAGPVRIVRGDPARTSMPLDEFERRVRALAVAP